MRRDKMLANNQSVKVGTDLVFIKLIWSAWFLSLLFVLYVGMRIFGFDIDEGYMTFSYRPSKVFMFVVGVMSVSTFLTFYVKQGVTRKAYFIGAAVSSCIISFVHMIVAGIVTFGEQLFVPSAETATFLGEDASLLLTVMIFTLNVIIYYMAGWLIGAGFYKFGGVMGFIYILLAAVFIIISDILWQLELEELLQPLVDISFIMNTPLYASIIGTLLLIGIMMGMVRALTKKVRIKIK